MTSVTHGKRIEFLWDIKNKDILLIKNLKQPPIFHEYTTGEILRVISWLYNIFGETYFPLGNNVVDLSTGNATDGLGKAIYENDDSRNTFHAQGASYLGVILSEAGIFEWNQEQKGICWKIAEKPKSADDIAERLSKERQRRPIPHGTFP